MKSSKSTTASKSPKAAANKATPKAAETKAPAAEKAPAAPKEKAVPQSAIQIADAVAGVLKADPAHAAKKGDERFGKVDDRGQPTGRPVGTSTGLGIQMAWCFIFQSNEKAAAAKRLNDEAITNWLKKEFPGRESGVFNNVQGVRTKYNQGGLTRGEVPSVISHRYEDGKLADPGVATAEKEAAAKKNAAAAKAEKKAAKEAAKA